MPNGFRSCLLPFLFLTLPAGAADGDVCVRHGHRCADLVYRGLTYPYERQPSSYLYINGGVYPYVDVTDDLLGASTVQLPDESVMEVAGLLQSLGLEDKVDAQLVPVIGYGSNPAPSQIARKFSARAYQGDVVVPVMKGVLHGFDVVWTPAFVTYGSMPATVAPSPGTDVDVWITWLEKGAEKAMDETEHSNPEERPLYVQATLDDARYSFDGPDPDQIGIYVSCFGPLAVDYETFAVSEVPARGRTIRTLTSPQAIAKVTPRLGWRGSVIDLIYSNVVDASARADRNARLRALGSLPVITGASNLDACQSSWEGPGKAY